MTGSHDRLHKHVNMTMTNKYAESWELFTGSSLNFVQCRGIWGDDIFVS